MDASRRHALIFSVLILVAVGVRCWNLSLQSFSNDEVIELSIKTAALTGTGIERALLWGGALLQDPHRAMAAQRGIGTDGVYVAYFSYGSPATRYGLWAGRRVVEVNETPTPNLQAFIDVVKDIEHRESVRVKTDTSVATSSGSPVCTRPPAPEYSPSEFSRTMTQSRSPGPLSRRGVAIPGRMRVGRTLAYWSKPWQIGSRRPQSVTWSGISGAPTAPK